MTDDPDPVRTRDVAEYVAEVTLALAVMAREVGLSVAASALDTAHRAAEDALRRNGLDEDAA